MLPHNIRWWMNVCKGMNKQIEIWVSESREMQICVFSIEIDLEDFILLLFPSFTAFCQTWRKEIKTRIKAGRVWPNQLALKCWLFCNLGVWKTALKTKPENADIITALVSGGSWNPSYHPTTIPPIPTLTPLQIPHLLKNKNLAHLAQTTVLCRCFIVHHAWKLLTVLNAWGLTYPLRCY